jgi:hypothetical protein
MALNQLASLRNDRSKARHNHLQGRAVPSQLKSLLVIPSISGLPTFVFLRAHNCTQCCGCSSFRPVNMFLLLPFLAPLFLSSDLSVSLPHHLLSFCQYHLTHKVEILDIRIYLFGRL